MTRSLDIRVISAVRPGDADAQRCAVAGDGIRVNSVSPGWTWSNVMVELSGDDRAKTDRVAAPSGAEFIDTITPLMVRDGVWKHVLHLSPSLGLLSRRELLGVLARQARAATSCATA